MQHYHVITRSNTILVVIWDRVWPEIIVKTLTKNRWGRAGGINNKDVALRATVSVLVETLSFTVRPAEASAEAREELQRACMELDSLHRLQLQLLVCGGVRSEDLFLIPGITYLVPKKDRVQDLADVGLIIFP